MKIEKKTRLLLEVSFSGNVKQMEAMKRKAMNKLAMETEYHIEELGESKNIILFTVNSVAFFSAEKPVTELTMATDLTATELTVDSTLKNDKI